MESFTLGTGASIYSQKLLPAILSAEHEVILVTCFWARSKTLTALSDTLEQLARRREGQQPSQPLRICICFSSRSLLQKLFHTSSRDGYVYPASTWTTKLGLPSPSILAAGNIDLRVKSLFFLPFSVMHPKFVIVDRQKAFAPSCNVSWESWLEGCLEFTRSAPINDPIDGLLEFYCQVWDRHLDVKASFPMSQKRSQEQPSTTIRSPADVSVQISDVNIPPAAIEWLPSWHRRNPAFCFFPWQTPIAPDTPLNNTILRLFEQSTRTIYLQTPNITAPPVLAAIMNALTRGVDVSIVTGRNMMMWEQVLTAFTTSERCINSLTKKYTRLCQSIKGRNRPLSQSANDHAIDLEAQLITPGALTISYFRPINGSSIEEEPVQSHLKLSIFDEEHTVLGSGNMDRASWFTSQELGVYIRDVTFARTVKDTVDECLQGRLTPVFPRH
ncbi:hypothetical protein N0V93_007057 [Gnomoniopsis smithogilvyi]|uniref:PLD phosphodiesterase domain-containing protein n=1 Tax=Gnomoniopsis smithogilvyi TaxID=1191159 RepID=A0A9W9CW71_9PEZI|nr:hypothetical protein N0V93_007057 [Gnomoniopsis smithogilvyi]